MELDISTPAPNYRFNYINEFYQNCIKPVIGDKIGEFLKLNERFSSDFMEQRENAYIELMCSHIHELSESSPRYKKMMTDMLEAADKFSEVMLNKHNRLRNDAMEAVRAYTTFQQQSANVRSHHQLFVMLAEHPNLA